MSPDGFVSHVPCRPIELSAHANEKRSSQEDMVVERIVLENLKEVIRYVSNYEDEFVRMVMDADVRQKTVS